MTAAGQPEIATIRPPADERLGPLRDRIRALPVGADLAARRAGALASADGDAAWLAEEGYAVEPVDVGGVPALVITPPGPHGPGLLVGFHGGGYVLCSAATHAKRFALVGAAAGCRVIVVDYRLAPEHRFPAAADDAVTAARWAAALGPTVLLGDSAGGGLALSAAWSLRHDRAGSPAGIVAISPWTDLTLGAASLVDRLARDPFAHIDDLPAYASAYLGEAGDPRDPRASPLFADLAGLPPVLVQVGSEESMFDDGARFARAAAAAGASVRLEEWEGMFHTWHAHAGELTGADQAIAALGTWVRARLAAR